MNEIEALSFIVLLLALLPTLMCLCLGTLVLYFILVSPISMVFKKIHNLTKIPEKIIYLVFGIPVFYYAYGFYLEILGFLIKYFGNLISSIF